MNILELAAHIGKSGLLTIGQLRIPVTVLDARKAYGRAELKVTPVGGSGESWIRAENYEETK